ncbi:transglycosylase SLT domain-containing protein [Telmatospirillum sp.]|uniref:transglycosylase SLT domain-containing protein n=1 Tax=Telmatospirillum sp. TaxID=2079197 RepID=UPI00283AE9E7|nr:transglycosylase SLT domain-containing protein [Telmatospirillum sp.]MDR3435886.1 transglycosylase SLT domain-containing protein [Telmatospirillum sp.]
MKQSDPQTGVQLAAQPAASRVLPNIQSASKSTGVSFSYLMAQAGKESAFESEAGSRASSAAGLFQFTRNTWLHLIKTHGGEHGLGDLAEQIHRNHKGDYGVHDAKARQQILDLRRDPQISAMMAGEYAKDNKAWLEKNLGRPVDSTDLYMAHFLGPSGAAKVLKAQVQNPAQSAVELLPLAARKNPSVFYDTDHSPRSVAAVYDKIHHSIDRPMKQYAELEPGSSATAATEPTASRHGHVKTARNDQPWPFETGQWPPTYVPTRLQAAAAAAEAAASTEKVQQVAYTDGSQSAAQISAPMPPAPGVADNSHTPLAKLLKSLFG